MFNSYTRSDFRLQSLFLFLSAIAAVSFYCLAGLVASPSTASNDTMAWLPPGQFEPSTAMPAVLLAQNNTASNGRLLSSTSGIQRISGRKRALLIGVSQYEDYSKLRGAAVDAAKMYAALIKLGFRKDDMVLLSTETNKRPTKQRIEDELENLSAQVQPGDLVFVYFSGHGRTSGSKSYLMPVDTRKNAFEETTIAAETVADTLSRLPAEAVIAAYDMCRYGREKGLDSQLASNQLLNDLRLRRWRDDSGAKMRITMYSCSNNQSSYEGEYIDRSIFSYFLEEGIKGKADGRRGGVIDGYVSMIELKEYVYNQVKSLASIEKRENQWPDITLAGYGVEDLTLQSNPVYTGPTPTPAPTPIPKIASRIEPPRRHQDTPQRNPWIPVSVTDLAVKRHTVIPYTVTGYKPFWWNESRDGSYEVDGGPTGRPVITMRRTDFFSTDSSGARRHIGKGMFYEGMSPDGKTLYGSKPNKGLFAMDIFGKGLRQVTTKPVGSCQFLSDGQHALVTLGWRYEKSRQEWGTLNLRWSEDDKYNLWKDDGFHNQYVLDLKTGALNLLTSLTTFYGVQESASGSRLQIADYAKRRLTLTNLSGGSRREVAKMFRNNGNLFLAGLWQSQVLNPQSLDSTSMEISPSGEWVSESSYDYSNSSTKTTVRSLLQNRTLTIPGDLHWLAASNRIVFSRREGRNQDRWYVGSISSLDRAKALPATWSFCSPSPDGRKIAYIERGRLGVGDLTNNSRRVLSNLGISNNMPTWIAGGRALTCVRENRNYPLEEAVWVGS